MLLCEDLLVLFNIFQLKVQWTGKLSAQTCFPLFKTHLTFLLAYRYHDKTEIVILAISRTQVLLSDENRTQFEIFLLL